MPQKYKYNQNLAKFSEYSSNSIDKKSSSSIHNISDLNENYNSQNISESNIDSNKNLASVVEISQNNHIGAYFPNDNINSDKPKIEKKEISIPIANSTSGDKGNGSIFGVSFRYHEDKEIQDTNSSKIIEKKNSLTKQNKSEIGQILPLRRKSEAPQGTSMKSFLDSLSSPRVMDAPFRKKSVQVNVNVSLQGLDIPNTLDSKNQSTNKSIQSNKNLSIHSNHLKNNSNKRKGGGYQSARFRPESARKEKLQTPENEMFKENINDKQKESEKNVSIQLESTLNSIPWKQGTLPENAETISQPAPPSSKPSISSSQRRFTVKLGTQGVLQDGWNFESRAQTPYSQQDKSITLENDAYRSYINGENTDIFQNEVLSSLAEDDLDGVKSLSSLSMYTENNFPTNSQMNQIYYSNHYDLLNEEKRNSKSNDINASFLSNEEIEIKLKELTTSFQEKLKKQHDTMYIEMMKEKEKYTQEINTIKNEYEQKLDEVMRKYFTFKSDKRKYEKFQKEKFKFQQQIQSLNYDLQQSKIEMEKLSNQNANFVNMIDRIQIENEKLKQNLKAVTEERDQALDDLEKEKFDKEILSELRKEIETSRIKILKFKEEAALSEKKAKEQQELYEQEKRQRVKLDTNTPSFILESHQLDPNELLSRIDETSWIENGSLEGSLSKALGVSVMDQLSGSLSGFSGDREEDIKYVNDFTNHVQKQLVNTGTEKLRIIIKDDSIPISKRKQNQLSKYKEMTRNYFEDRLQTMKNYIEAQTQFLVSILHKIRKEIDEGSFAFSDQKQFLETIETEILSNKSQLNSALVIISDTLNMIKLSI